MKTVQSQNLAKRLFGLLITGCLALVMGAPVRAALMLVQTGGSYTPNNLAIQPGATAFAQDVLAGGSIPAHQIFHLNDGIYGNANSWIGDASPAFAGISFGGSFTIDQIAFGRDNTGGSPDRYQANYMVQYTTNAVVNASTPDADWFTIGTLDYYNGSPSQPASPWLRHLWSFDPVTATGIRLSNMPGGFGDGVGIDELEAYAAVPEPSVVALVCLGGLLTWWRPKQRK